MFGINSCNFMGRLVDDVVLRQDNEGKPYCYFKLVINYPDIVLPGGDKKPRAPQFVEFVANGGTASAIAKYGKKGKVLAVYDCKYKTSQSKSEKDGVTTIYKEGSFSVPAGHFEFAESKEKENGSAADYSAPPPQAPAPVQPTSVSTSPDEDYADYNGDSFSTIDDDACDSLPY